MIPRVVATDLDGTLLRSDGTIDAQTRRILAELEAAGTMVVLCTARPPGVMRALAEATGHRGVAVCSNGAVIWDLHTETVVDEFPLAVAAAREIVACLGTALPEGTWAVQRTHAFAREPGHVPPWPEPEGTIVAEIEALLAAPAVNLMMHHPLLDPDELLGRGRQLVGHLGELCHSSSAHPLLEIQAAGVSKASGLATLCARRGIARGEVMAFGDMPNDLAMLRWAGRSVAVANAHRTVIEAADEVTASNDDAGVARVLARFVERGQ